MTFYLDRGLKRLNLCWKWWQWDRINISSARRRSLRTLWRDSKDYV